MPQLLSSVEVDAYAHCPAILDDPATGKAALCRGFVQEKVTARREEVGHTYLDSGGDNAFIENSFVSLHWIDPDQEACPHCDGPRQLAEQVRPKYQNMSRKDPLGLLGLRDVVGDDESRVVGARDAEMAEMRAEMERMADELKRLTKPAPKTATRTGADTDA